ncbi:ABC transporter permease [Phreatobacter stygius]|uniref:ABC transporter permease n=1 Tax=Phreatobacter stygius TaxID=1940610 RepID=A0A4D7AZI5_9HYPH|nr:ABC transporter permease [Phreatobacter stygius]QCI64765.1 ABC transporter permease [Phreatobacter stygius]
MIEAWTILLVACDSAIRLSVPLIFACLAGLYSERAGVVDIGLEGKLLVGAFAAGATAAVIPNPWIGLAAAIGTSVVFALIHGFASISQRGNQIVSGVALNVLASGLTAVLGNAWFDQGGRTPQLPASARFNEITLPLAETAAGVPVIGTFYADIISGHSVPVYLAFILVPITAFALYQTRWGLRLRAVGENPAAVDTAGVSVARLRYQAVIVAGILCGMGGAYLAIAQSAGFINDMTAGKGFIALAALIFAKWRPWAALGACLLFGLMDATALRIQGASFPGIGQVPVQAIQALPYIFTVVLLAGFIGRATPPKASGIPYVKDRT